MGKKTSPVGMPPIEADHLDEEPNLLSHKARLFLCNENKFRDSLTGYVNCERGLREAVSALSLS